MSNIFRIRKDDTIKAKLMDKNGKLIMTLYDSGFTNVPSVKKALKNKAVNPPRGCTISIYNETKDEFYVE